MIMQNINYVNRVNFENNVKNTIASVTLGLSNFLLIAITGSTLTEGSWLQNFTHVSSFIFPVVVTLLAWYFLYVNDIKILPKLSVVKFIEDNNDLEDCPVNIFLENPIGEMKFYSVKRLHTTPRFIFDEFEEEL